MSNEIEKAIELICEEKGISKESVIATIEHALASAYKKDFGEKGQNVRVVFDPKTGGSEVHEVKTVVEDDAQNEEPKEGEEKKKPFNPKTEILLSDAKQVKSDSAVGGEIRTKLDVPAAYGRMAAQTAKQVIIQRIREAEREKLYNDFKSREHTVMVGTVQRRDIRNVLIDIGKLTTIMPPNEQIEREQYRTGDRIKVYILSVAQTNRGPEVVVSRSSVEIVRAVFTNEIPEIQNGTIEIKAITREAGSRSKVAVSTNDENIDPIGSCVGQRGTRVQTIITELGGEKIDIIKYDEDHKKYIANALSPAKPEAIVLNESEKTAQVTVPEEQLSLAIGRSGQNVRLASKLTGWKLDIITNKEKSSEELSEKKEDKVDISDNAEIIQKEKEEDKPI